MIIRLFKTSHTATAIFLPLLAAVMMFPFLKFESPYWINAYSLLAGNGFAYFAQHPILTYSLSVIIVTLEALYLHVIVERYGLLRKQSFLPAVFFILFNAAIPEFQGFIQGQTANLFLLLAINRLLSIAQDETLGSNLFDSSILISIGSLFHFPLAALGAISMVSLFLFRQSRWRHWIIMIIGLLLPYLFASAYCYITDRWHLMGQHISLSSGGTWNSIQFISNYFLIGIASLILLLAAYPFFSELAKNKVRTQKNLTILSWLMVLAILTGMLFFGYGAPILIYCAIPLSVYLANYFVCLRIPLLAEILFSLLLGIILINQMNYLS